jgi:hypothetical protein
MQEQFIDHAANTLLIPHRTPCSSGELLVLWEPNTFDVSLGEVASTTNLGVGRAEGFSSGVYSIATS